MKFWEKLVLFIVAAISVILAYSRFTIVSSNFQYAIQSVGRQKTNQHFLEKYMLETAIIRSLQEGRSVTDETLFESVRLLCKYLENEEEYTVILAGGEHRKIYSNMDQVQGGAAEVEQYLSDLGGWDGLFQDRTDSYRLRTIGGKHYMLFTSCWEIERREFCVLHLYDIESIYEERDRQSREILMMDIFILAVSSAVIAVFSVFLTRPLKKLRRISRKIAMGSYHERVRIRSGDEIGELAESFNSMADQVESRMAQLELMLRQRDDFISGFTHELKTPMTAIMGYADMLRLRKCDEAVSQKALNYIYAEARRLERLSFRMMELMSLTQERISPESLDVEQLVKKVQRIEQGILKESRIVTELEPYRIWGDRELLTVVLRNLIENADKAQPADHRILIRGEILEEGGYRFSVIDRGKGIPKEHLGRVTEDFYMVDKSRSRKSGGSGIGLSLVKKILQLHQAELLIESREGAGTRVSFVLEGAPEDGRWTECEKDGSV